MGAALPRRRGLSSPRCRAVPALTLRDVATLPGDGKGRCGGMERGGTNPVHQLCAEPALHRGPFSVPCQSGASHGTLVETISGCQCGAARGRLQSSSSSSSIPKLSSHPLRLSSPHHGRGQDSFPLPRLPTPARVIYDSQVSKLIINQRREGGTEVPPHGDRHRRSNLAAGTGTIPGSAGGVKLCGMGKPPPSSKIQSTRK